MNTSGISLIYTDPTKTIILPSLSAFVKKLFLIQNSKYEFLKDGYIENVENYNKVTRKIHLDAGHC